MIDPNKERMMKFRIGDMVRAIGTSYPESCPIGSIVTIDHIDKDGDYWCRDFYFREEELEFAAGQPNVECTDGNPNACAISVGGYESLRDVLNRAFDQAAKGKGADRHANGRAFDRQPMQDLIRLYGIGFALGQAAKKAQESQRMDEPERKVKELLGAIVYIAGAIIAIEGEK